MNEAGVLFILFQLKIFVERAKNCDKVDEQNEVLNMRIFNRTIIKFSVFLILILLFGQTVLSQENKCLSFNDTLTKLSSGESKDIKQINNDLINEIQKRKVNFVLTATEEKLLKKTGANSSLINAIRANLFNESKEASDLYKIYADITSIESSEIEQAKKLIEVAEEYVRRFEKVDCYKEQVNYFKQSIPILKKAIEQKIKQDEINAKNKYKYELLDKITKAYKAKNLNEVFTLGEKVLEIDSELTPLILVLAGVGFDQAKINGDKSEFNDETIRYAELAIKLLETEKESKNKYGALDYEYKSKTEAIDKMKEILDHMKSQNLYKTTPENTK